MHGLRLGFSGTPYGGMETRGEGISFKVKDLGGGGV